MRVWKSPGIGIRSLEEEEETGGAPHQARSLFRLQLKEETMLNPRKERETRESAPSGILDRTLRMTAPNLQTTNALVRRIAVETRKERAFPFLRKAVHVGIRWHRPPLNERKQTLTVQYSRT